MIGPADGAASKDTNEPRPTGEAVTPLQRRSRRRDKVRWVLPIDGNHHQERAPRESTLATASYAFAAGLLATILGALVSIVIPGRGFLAVWAFVTVVVSVSAGWYADQVQAAVHRLAHALLKD